MIQSYEETTYVNTMCFMYDVHTMSAYSHTSFISCHLMNPSRHSAEQIAICTYLLQCPEVNEIDGIGKQQDAPSTSQSRCFTTDAFKV
jgi:hypothetical protein